MEELTAANIEESAAPEEPTLVPDPAAPEPTPEPDISQTKAFSERLNKMAAEREKAAFDKANGLIAKLNGTMADGTPITTIEQLEQALAQQELQAEAEKQQVPVEVLSRLTQAEKDALEAKAMLSEYKRKETLAEEAKTLSAHQDWGKFFAKHEKAIYEAADKYQCSLGAAKLIVLDEVGPEKVDIDAISNKAIQEYLDKKRTYAPVEGGGASLVQVSQTPKTFEDARKGAIELMRSLRGG